MIKLVVGENVAGNDGGSGNGNQETQSSDWKSRKPGTSSSGVKPTDPQFDQLECLLRDKTKTSKKFPTPICKHFGFGSIGLEFKFLFEILTIVRSYLFQKVKVKVKYHIIV